MFKDRYTVGNVCLVVFLAFIFSVIVATVKVEQAAAAPPFTMYPTEGTGTAAETPDGDGKYPITITLQLNPVTDTNFGSLKYYVKLLDQSGNPIVDTKFSFGTAEAVYGSVYARLVTLVYDAPQAYALNPTFSFVYASIYQGATPDIVYLDLTVKPPTGGGDEEPGNGGGGGVAPSGPVTVISDVGDLTLTQNTATLETNTTQLVAAANQLPPGEPLVIPVAPAQIRPTMEYVLPASAQEGLAGREVTLPAQDANLTLSLDEIPPPTSPAMAGASLRITLSTTDSDGANIGFAETFGSGDFVAAAPSYRLEITWVSPSGQEERVPLADLERLLRFTVSYDPSVVTDPSRLTGIQRDDEGNVTPVPRSVVNTANHTVDLYLNHLSYYSVVQSTKQFNDIASHWANADITAMAARGIANGQPSGDFEPDNSVTRAQFAALLVRTLGKSGVSPATPKFVDAPAWAWYYSAVESAVQLGLVTGYEDGTYKPDARITRQEMAAMIVRAMNLHKTAPTMDDAEIEQTLQVFADQGAVQAWARESTAKAIKAGIVQGRTLTSFQPTSDATRAEAIVMLKRLLKHHGHIQ